MLVKISGYVGTPQSAGRNPQQFFFVNGRYMNHPYFRRAVLQAYERMISAEDAPQFFLNLEVDPSTIDVNIHPTKTEIKFENEREIWSILSIAVKEALGKFNVAPSIDFDTTDSIDIPVATPTDGIIPEMPKVTFNPNYNPFQSRGTNYHTQSSSVSRNWKDLFEGRKEELEDRRETLQPQEIFANKDIQSKSPNSQLSEFNTQHPTFEDTFLYKNRYLCVPMKSGLMFVDIQRAIARICYDKLLLQVEKSVGASQKLLFPEVLELSLDDKCLFTEIEIELKAVGFEIAEFGKSMYRIEGIPALLSEGVDVLKILETIIEEVKNSGVDVSDSVHRIIANILSQSEATIRIKHNMSPEERNSLIAQLFASSNPNNTPDGRKIINTLTDATIDAMF
jgi:DNA mismatch repair protein MutL